MSIFDGAAGAQSSEAELAGLIKDNPDLAGDSAPASTHEVPTGEGAPQATAEATPPTAEATAPGKEQPEAAAEESPQAPGKTVPLAALTEERNARRDLERQMHELRGQLQAAMQMRQPPQEQPQPQAQQEQAPDPDQDPIGALKWTQRQLARQTEINQGHMLTQRVQRDYGTDAMRFAQKQADFPAAYEHLINSRVTELRAQGWQDERIQAQLQHEEFNIAFNALRERRSPAEAIYGLAKARGYQQATPKPPAAKPAIDPALAEAKARAAVSLSEGGKPEKGGELSWEEIANLRGAAQDSAIRAKEVRMRRQSIFRE